MIKAYARLYTRFKIAYNNRMIFRAALPSDIRAIMDIEAASFDAATRESEEIFLSRIEICKNCFIVFEDAPSHTICGYFSAEKWEHIPDGDKAFSLEHDPASSHRPTGSVLYLSSFAILPSYRSKGIGKKLFAQSVDRFSSQNPEVKTALLLVNEAWRGALHIYKKNGFSEFRRIENFFTEDGVKTAGIVMTKAL